MVHTKVRLFNLPVLYLYSTFIYLYFIYQSSYFRPLGSVQPEAYHRPERLLCVAGPYKCATCGAVYQHVNSYRCHMQMHRGRTQCHVCQRVFDRPTRLNEHLYSVHGVRGAYSPRPRFPRPTSVPERAAGRDGVTRWPVFGPRAP